MNGQNEWPDDRGLARSQAAVTVRDRSYWLREGMEGIMVEVTMDSYSDGPVPAGTRGTVYWIANAGFDGIRASLVTTEGRTIHSISAGRLCQV